MASGGSFSAARNTIPRNPQEICVQLTILSSPRFRTGKPIRPSQFFDREFQILPRNPVGRCVCSASGTTGSPKSRRCLHREFRACAALRRIRRSDPRRCPDKAETAAKRAEPARRGRRSSSAGEQSRSRQCAGNVQPFHRSSAQSKPGRRSETSARSWKTGPLCSYRSSWMFHLFTCTCKQRRRTVRATALIML